MTRCKKHLDRLHLKKNEMTTLGLSEDV